MHGGKLRSLVLAAMQTRVFAAKFLRFYAAGNTVIGLASADLSCAAIPVIRCNMTSGSCRPSRDGRLRTGNECFRLIADGQVFRGTGA